MSALHVRLARPPERQLARDTQHVSQVQPASAQVHPCCCSEGSQRGRVTRWRKAYRQVPHERRCGPFRPPLSLAEFLHPPPPPVMDQLNKLATDAVRTEGGSGEGWAVAVPSVQPWRLAAALDCCDRANRRSGRAAGRQGHAVRGNALALAPRRRCGREAQQCGTELALSWPAPEAVCIAFFWFRLSPGRQTTRAAAGSSPAPPLYWPAGPFVDRGAPCRPRPRLPAPVAACAEHPEGCGCCREEQGQDRWSGRQRECYN